MNLQDTESTLKAIRATLAEDQVRSLLASAVRYAHIRAEFRLPRAEERSDRNSERTAAHNSFIDSCNAASRAMATKGADVEWRRALGHDRHVLGDFACMIHCVLGIEAR